MRVRLNHHSQRVCARGFDLMLSSDQTQRQRMRRLKMSWVSPVVFIFMHKTLFLWNTKLAETELHVSSWEQILSYIINMFDFLSCCIISPFSKALSGQLSASCNPWDLMYLPWALPKRRVSCTHPRYNLAPACIGLLERVRESYLPMLGSDKRTG